MTISPRFQSIALACSLLGWAVPSDAGGLGSSRRAAAGCLKGDCMNGFGTYEYSSGDRYVGSFNQGRPHGQGILYCVNGNKYLGDWEHARRQGQGKFLFREGHEYLGDFRQDKFHGRGVMKFANGDHYAGDWQFSMPDGHGVYTFRNNDRYEGGFARGHFNGQGTLYHKDGSRFAGNWKNGKRHGTGVFYDAAGCPYPGTWDEGSGPAVYSPADVEVADSPLEAGERAAVSAPSPRIWAVIAGIASYAHVPSLRYTDDDAYVFHAFLKSPEGGALPDQQIHLLVDEQATRENLLHALRDAASRATAADVLVFYFSGHGLPGAFLPVDCEGSQNQLLHEEVWAALEQSPAKSKLVFSDACHSGTLANIGQDDLLSARGAPVEFPLEKYYSALASSRGGTALILSSRGREVSLEASGLRSGVFSHFLVKGLKGEADAGDDGLVSVGELYAFVRARVKSYTAGAQTPVLAGDIDREMPLAVVRR